ncbi:YifB family Mg chelatase-like AAA ATPase [Bifidobacterium vansinderenii]|uniref:ATPase AAA n=1 Tax=Bifidobacterium vansinderenii TaxID=1984871 RepID=A0A229VYI5_9BIFI|nr:YifB family Mg chelatase-like AAA ATPase [Bifidobacterium vansinderenii]OXN00460.1 ATPase AAA [Bifidobacterium vansinderenii]
MRIGTTLSVGLHGLKAFTVSMQAYISPGLPYFSIIGLPDTSLSEARERVKSACASAGFSWPETRVTVNLSPASLPKSGAGHDLAIAASVLCAGGAIPHDSLADTLVLGELKLDGSVLPVAGLLPILLHARNSGIARAFIPHGNLEESELVPDIDVVPVRHVGELIEHMGGKTKYRIPDISYDLRAPSFDDPLTDEPATGLDMNQVMGQEHTKWALEVAAAGGHHVIMVGPPGTGKTMLASRLPTIMPPMNERQQLEVASIRSLCGTLTEYGITDVPPYEAPHHTASVAALVGGGSGMARPGAITRAHNGVLFMDEAPEFPPRVLQTIREPLETGYVAISRSKGNAHYPARFQLVMAANPCPCGFGWGTGEKCVCSSKERTRYWNRLSGPILDRIDIQITVPPISTFSPVCETPAESSATIRARVIEARNAAAERYRFENWPCNAKASGDWLRRNTSSKAMAPLSQALEQQRLSLRGADRALRLAWTLADVAGRTSPDAQDVSSGIALRTRLR